MLEWIKQNWKTTACGAGIIACAVASLFVPGLGMVCSVVGSTLTGLGFISAADAATANQLAQTLKDTVGRTKSPK